MFNAPLVFVFLLRLSLEKMPKWNAYVIHTVAKVSLPIYLVSHVLDSVWYPILNAHIALEQRIYYYPISIVVTFGGSFILAFVVEKISSRMYSLVDKIMCRIGVY